MLCRSFLLFSAVLGNVAFAQDLPKVSEVVVYKSARTMELQDSEHKAIRTYTIALGGNPVGPKRQSGDEKTPEGVYKISAKNAKSRFHLALRISYPNEQDVADAERRGVSTGGDIMIHGLRNGLGWLGSWHLWYDTWTDGCIAVTNDEIEEIWNLVPVGTPVDIRS